MIPDVWDQYSFKHCMDTATIIIVGQFTRQQISPMSLSVIRKNCIHFKHEAWAMSTLFKVEACHVPRRNKHVLEADTPLQIWFCWITQVATLNCPWSLPMQQMKENLDTDSTLPDDKWSPYYWVCKQMLGFPGFLRRSLAQVSQIWWAHWNQDPPYG